jgi:starch-binding outer membrane protein, SusD/RagB family
MKNYFLYFILSLSILLSFTSCEKWLEVEPDQGLIIAEYWKSKEDVEATLMAAYRNFALLDEHLFLYGELRADMISAGSNVQLNEDRIMRSNITSDNEFSRWDGFYKMIHHCNLILEHSDRVKEIDPNFSTVMLRSFQSEALFLRSLAYFYLVRVFKDVPLILHSSEKDDVDFFIPKTESHVILDTLISHLQLAGSRISKTRDYGSEQANRGRASWAAINALLADIYLWNFDYEKCIETIQQIEDLNRYALMSAANWFSIFNPGNSLESIFEFQFNQAINLPNNTYRITFGTNRYNVSSYALELFSNEINRLDGSICLTYNLHSNKNAEFIWKYCGATADGRSVRPASDNRSANFIIYRLADLKLMKAEALSQLGMYDEAFSIINEIRTRAGALAYVSINNTPASFEDAILEERAIELAYEGKRWFDLLRMGRRNNYTRRDLFIEIMIRDVPASQKRILATRLVDPMGWYLPIHQQELERNNVLTQNSYYQQ